MAFILLVDLRSGDALKAAAAYLEASGHRVVMMWDGQAVRTQLHQEAPDIIVLDPLLPSGIELIQDLYLLPPTITTRVILIPLRDNVTGNPGTYWTDPRICNFIIRPYKTRDVVTAVEQLLYRRIQFEVEDTVPIMLTVLTRRIMQYARDNAGRLPGMDNAEMLRSALMKFTLQENIWQHPTTHVPFTPNPALSGKKYKSIIDPSNTVAVFDSSQPVNSCHWAGLFGGSLESPFPRARLMPAKNEVKTPF